MKKAWNDLKSFITVVTMILFSYCIIFKVPIDDTSKSILATVVGFFLGSQSMKNKEGD